MALSHHSLPVTALETYHDPLALFVLAGTGTFLQLLAFETARVYDAAQVFEAQTIHGFSRWGSSTSPVDDLSALYLVWGGKSLRVIAFCHSVLDNSLKIRKLSQEFLLDDWILDVYYPWKLDYSSNRSWKALILSSHNVASLVSFQPESTDVTTVAIGVTKVAVGPASMLYSAHMHTVDGYDILIASGTVFGEVVLWTFRTPLTGTATRIQTSKLLHSFPGHEGSVFGVQLLSPPSTSLSQAPARTWIASCSDDRTIRLWGYSERATFTGSVYYENTMTLSSETGFSNSHDRSQQQKSCIAATMGHESRIWSLLPFPASAPLPRLLTFGEDGTTQLWRVGNIKNPVKTNHDDLVIELEASRAYHTGKNIWAKVLLDEGNHVEPDVVTGGADGRVVVFGVINQVSPHGFDAIYVPLAALSSKGEIDTMKLAVDYGKPQSRTRSLFQDMLGKWTLYRKIKSKLPTYPSGTFRGTAIITPRESSSNIYDLEYLYEEEGSLTTEQGLTLRGTRCYVYRYQQKTDTISAWFVKPENKSVVDYLFHEVKFKKSDQTMCVGNEGRAIKAQGHHLCIDDDYDAEYEFISKSEELEKWSIKYQVVGPKKDYTLYASYTQRLEFSRASADKQIAQPKPRVEEPKMEREPTKQLPSRGSLKSYCWQNETQLLAITDIGNVARATLIGKSKGNIESRPLTTELDWEYIAHTPDLSFQSLAVRVEQFNSVLLTGKAGIVYGVSGQRRLLDEVIRLPSKVNNLFVEHSPMSFVSTVALCKASSIGIVATCVGLPSAFVFRLGLENQSNTGMLLTLREAKRLSLLPNTIITSACWSNAASGKKLILGTRSGALLIFVDPHSTESQAQNPLSCIYHVHIEDSVTVIQNLPQAADSVAPFLLTAGRDGRYAIHRLLTDVDERDETIGLETIHEGEPPLGPNIEGAMFNGITKDLILWGFKGRHFIVWNESKARGLMEIDCGGAHRTWAYYRDHNSAEGGRLIWTKASECHLRIQSQPSHRVLRTGTHGREIKAMAVHPLGGEHHMLATGAEDTTIRIAKYDRGAGTEAEPFEYLGLIRKHRTGIQQLWWSQSGRFLLSAGGSEELYAWRVQSIPGVGIGITQCCQCPPVSESRDLRVTNFDVHSETEDAKDVEGILIVGAVYSDSSLRVIRLLPENRFELIRAGLALQDAWFRTRLRTVAICNIYNLLSDADQADT